MQYPESSINTEPKYEAEYGKYSTDNLKANYLVNFNTVFKEMQRKVYNIFSKIGEELQSSDISEGTKTTVVNWIIFG